MRLTQTQEPEFPLGKLIALICGAGLILGLLGAWFMDFQTVQQADEFYATAQDHFKNNRAESSLASIKRALLLKEKPEYLKLKVDVLLNQNKPYEADLVLEKLLPMEPKAAHLRSLSGRLAYADENTDKAIQRYQEAIAIEPANTDYKVELANLYFRAGKAKEATALFDSLIEKMPQYKLAWNQYITALINQEKSEPAIALAQRSVAQFPTDSDFHFLLATAYDRAGQNQNAAASYLKSLELEPMKDSIAATRIFELTGKRVPLRLEQMDSRQVPFEREGKVMFVQARVNGRSGRFLLDTGASLSVLYSNRLADYGIHSTDATIEAETAGGMIQAPVAYADVEMGNQSESSLRFAILPPPKQIEADGIIGMNFLEKFRFEIDQNSHKITLQH